MKRFVRYCVISLYGGFIALYSTQAHAGKTVTSYNPSYGQPIRILSQWAIGNQRLYVYTADWCVDGHKAFAVYSVWYNHFTHELTVQLDGQAVTEVVCP